MNNTQKHVSRYIFFLMLIGGCTSGTATAQVPTIEHRIKMYFTSLFFSNHVNSCVVAFPAQRSNLEDALSRYLVAHNDSIRSGQRILEDAAKKNGPRGESELRKFHEMANSSTEETNKHTHQASCKELGEYFGREAQLTEFQMLRRDFDRELRDVELNHGRCSLLDGKVSSISKRYLSVVSDPVSESSIVQRDLQLLLDIPPLQRAVVACLEVQKKGQQLGLEMSSDFEPLRRIVTAMHGALLSPSFGTDSLAVAHARGLADEFLKSRNAD